MNELQQILLAMRASLQSNQASIVAMQDNASRQLAEKAMHDADRVLWDAFEAAGGEGIDWIFGGVL